MLCARCSVKSKCVSEKKGEPGTHGCSGCGRATAAFPIVRGESAGKERAGCAVVDGRMQPMPTPPLGCREERELKKEGKACAQSSGMKSSSSS